jgi:hypothetical protein
MHHRELVNNAIETAKHNHYQTSIAECHDPKQLFAVVQKLLGRKAESGLPSNDSDGELADLFNGFFIEKISLIRSSIPPSADPTPPGPPALTSMEVFNTIQ